MRAHLRRYWHLHTLAVAIVVMVALAIAGVFSSPQARHFLSVEVGGPHGTPTMTMQVPAAAVDQVAGSELDDHQGLKDETPDGASRAAIEAAREQQDRLAANDQLPIVTPLAAPEERGCLTRLVRNYSTRRGVRPRIFVLHYTVSPNRVGWSDVNAVVYEFDQAAFAASSNYVIDGEGHCAYIVRESDKAWTQAAFNPVSISVEVINSGHEPGYIAKAGLARLAVVISDALKRWQIPVQRGAITGGVVTRAGIVDHNQLGAVGGGHHDISPYRVDTVIAAVRAYRAKTAPKPKPTPKPTPKPKPKPVCTVKQLQLALNKHGARLAVDGIRGPLTNAALRKVGFASLHLNCRLPG